MAELTTSQAADLARYFLGPGWSVSTLPQPGGGKLCLLVSFPSLKTFQGSGWRSAFRAAGVCLPYRVTFVQVGARVMLGDRLIASCCSNTYAARIRDALNRPPDI